MSHNIHIEDNILIKFGWGISSTKIKGTMALSARVKPLFKTRIYSILGGTHILSCNLALAYGSTFISVAVISTMTWNRAETTCLPSGLCLAAFLKPAQG